MLILIFDVHGKLTYAYRGYAMFVMIGYCRQILEVEKQKESFINNSIIASRVQCTGMVVFFFFLVNEVRFLPKR